MKLPLIVMLPSIKEKIDIELDPLKFKSTKAISADAPPPSPLKRATVSYTHLTLPTTPYV